MISARYLCKESERVSWMKVLRVGGLIEVRRRFMNAVFFFKFESRELWTGKTSVFIVSKKSGGLFRGNSYWYLLPTLLHLVRTIRLRALLVFLPMI